MYITFSNFFMLFENSVDPDQLASDEASWSGSTLFSSAWCIHINNKIVPKMAEFQKLN